ncbi:MAG: NB-ARC domain-containing protein [Elainellaceae cyanobacterium]
MSPEEILTIANDVVFAHTNQHLTDLQRLLMMTVTRGKKYREIEGYNVQHLKNEAAALWKLLSLALGEKVTKSNVLSTLERYRQRPPLPRQDWADAPDVPEFWGRSEELSQLEQWMVADRCRLIVLLGMGGVGKTALAIKVSEQVAETFDSLIWRSLRDAPTLQPLLVELIKIVSNQNETELPETLGDAISRLIHYLQRSRCLLVLDNAEALFQPGLQTGHYRDGYEGYGTLFQRIGESRHQSCIILTSREKPREIDSQEGMQRPVRSMVVSGLHEHASQDFLIAEGLPDTTIDLKIIAKQYGGNPLALKIAATTIQSLFSNNTARFLQQSAIVFDDIYDLLEQQFVRLSERGQSVMYWLAINREAIPLSELQRDILEPISAQQLLETLNSLRRRSLIESTKDGFTLQNVVMEYVTSRFTQRICEELQTKQFNLFNRHALIKATGKDYIRQSQTRLILKPIAQQFPILSEQTNHILSIFKEEANLSIGYAAGNLLNLLSCLNSCIEGYDFSGLTIQQAYLKGVHLHHIDFSMCHFIEPAINYTFGAVSCLSFSPDGTLLATGDSIGTIRLWEIRSERCIATYHGYSSWIWSIDFHPDGNMIASASEDQTVRLWDITTHECLHVFQGHTNRVCSAVFSPSGTTLATGSNDHTVRLWDLSDYHCLHTIQQNIGECWALAFSPDGNQLAIGSGYDIHLWDFQRHECVHIFQGHTKQLWSLAMSPDGSYLVSSGQEPIIYLWDLKTFNCVHSFDKHQGWVWSIAISPDSQTFVSCSDDHTICLWDLKTYQCLYTIQGHFSRVRAVAYHPENRIIASGSDDQTVRLWDTHHYQCVHLLQGYNGAVWGVAYSPDGKILASGSENNSLQLWNTETYHHLGTLYGHTSRVRIVVFSPDGTLLASCSDDHTVRLWDIQRGECWHVFRGHLSWVWCVAFSPDGKRLASTGEDGTIRFWDIDSRRCIHIIDEQTQRLWAIAFTPDGRYLASGGEEQTIHLWNLSTYECIETYQGHDDLIWDLTFSPDGKTLASASGDRTVRLWNLETHTCSHVLEGHTHWILSVIFTPDGTRLATGSADQSVQLWDLSSFECVGTYREHRDIIWAIAFSPDGKTLASGSADETIRIWDIQTHHCLETLQSFKPYEGTNLLGTTGLTDTQRSSMLALGALASPSVSSSKS